MNHQTVHELLQFITRCPSSFHTVRVISDRLLAEGFSRLDEQDPWNLQRGGKYFVTRNTSSIIAFQIPSGDFDGFSLTASHTESPSFKLKPSPELAEGGCYVKLNTEKYGGMLLSTWFDRPLSVAGRVTVQNENGIESRLVNIDRDLLLIPSLAIHLSRNANDGLTLNPQKDLLPLYGDETALGRLWPTIAEAADTAADAILGADLFLYCRTAGSIWGSQGEFFSAPRLDDLECVYGTLQGFLSAHHTPRKAPVFCVFDNEEVGSGTRQGAKSTFLSDTLKRIGYSLGQSPEDHLRLLASSFMLSADNGHAVHPNQPERSDPTHRPTLNGGVLIKYNANQKYTTDAISEAVFRKICQEADVPYQVYVNRSDIPGGSTLGNLSAEKVSVCTVDIGLAQLAMHSSYETAGCRDIDALCRAVRAFYESPLTPQKDGVWRI